MQQTATFQGKNGLLNIISLSFVYSIEASNIWLSFPSEIQTTAQGGPSHGILLLPTECPTP